jgi:hypothetical protein
MHIIILEITVTEEFPDDEIISGIENAPGVLTAERIDE